MKLHQIVIGLTPFLFAGGLCGQTNQAERLLIPLLDPASQSNVLVRVSDFANGRPCPLEYTNVLSNANLFTSEEQSLIADIFIKYKSITTDVGPTGTVCVGLYKTNSTIKAGNRTAEVENWVVRYQYPNSGASEEITIGRSLTAKFRTRSDDGYDVYFSRVGDGTLLGFVEIKRNLINGLLVEFDDAHPQGTNWDYRLANFTESHLVEYRQYTNGMVLGKCIMWNARNSNLMLEAEFKKPYDWQKHVVQLP